MNFPLEDGKRATTKVGKRICADSVMALDGPLATRIMAEPDWRHRYPQYLGDLALVEARSADAAQQVAEAGLRSAHEQFVVVTDDGDVPLGSLPEPSGATFGTAEVVGTGERQRELTVPYRGRRLAGDELLRQLADWVHRGITEPSFGDAVGAVVRNPDWLDLSDRCFAILGAGAQMGPFTQLMSWGARVAAVDLPRPGTWQRLVSQARSSAGTMLVPTRGDSASDEQLAEAAGADLLTQVAELDGWLASVPGPLTVGNYGYLDGAAFVRLSMAFDELFVRLQGRRDDLSLAYLATPSDVFLVPRDAVRMAEQRYGRRTPAMMAAKALYRGSGRRYLRPNYTGVSTPEAGGFGMVNAIIPAQGPNYAVAKRLQRWRMVAARSEGLLTSVHVAPPTRTRSVHSNPLMEERQRLTAPLGIETFDADTSQALGAAILVHDLRNPSAPANPSVPLQHPHQIFMHAANPGGRWRVPLEPASSVDVMRRLDQLRQRLPLDGRGRHQG